MPSRSFQSLVADLWRSVQSLLNRLGIHPLVACLGIFFLIIVPRFVIVGGVIYIGYWLYRNGVFGQSGQGTGSKGGGRCRGGRGRR